MARPIKRRHVCLLPEVNKFGPMNKDVGKEDMIIMSVEEYETIRLIDLERLTQEESAQSMGVARSTIQRIYDEARKKLADALINGKTLKIKGGDYKLCEKNTGENRCGKQGCCRRNELKALEEINSKMKKDIKK